MIFFSWWRQITFISQIPFQVNYYYLTHHLMPTPGLWVFSPNHSIFDRPTVRSALKPLSTLPWLFSLFFPTTDCRLSLTKKLVGWSTLTWPTTEEILPAWLGPSWPQITWLHLLPGWKILPIEIFFAHGGQQQRGQRRLRRPETSRRFFDLGLRDISSSWSSGLEDPVQLFWFGCVLLFFLFIFLLFFSLQQSVWSLYFRNGPTGHTGARPGGFFPEIVASHLPGALLAGVRIPGVPQRVSLRQELRLLQRAKLDLSASWDPGGRHRALPP